jgi:FKBP-type peptidyl-prolyl cis-trans isomerase FklB
MDKLSYALGLGIGQQLAQMGAGEFLNISDFAQSITDVLQGNELQVPHREAQQIVNEYFQQQEQKMQAERQQKGKVAKEEGEKYLAENAKKDGVITTPSGLQYKVLVKGDGQVPQATDKVLVNYEGRLIDGTVFDASTKHGDKPASFRVDQVIKGWTEALTMMPVGSKWQIFIPQELAYGERNAGQIKPFSALIFDVELVGIDGAQK